MGGFFQGSEGKSKTESYPMTHYMPDWMKTSAENAMKGLIPTYNIGFGGQQFPIVSNQWANLMKTLYSPVGQTSVQTQGSMSPFAAMATAAMPFLPYSSVFGGGFPNIQTIRGGQGGGYGW